VKSNAPEMARIVLSEQKRSQPDSDRAGYLPPELLIVTWAAPYFCPFHQTSPFPASIPAACSPERVDGIQVAVLAD
jgi:hypothetical protein